MVEVRMLLKFLIGLLETYRLNLVLVISTLAPKVTPGLALLSALCVQCTL